MPKTSISDVLCLLIAYLLYKAFAGEKRVQKEESITGEEKLIN